MIYADSDDEINLNICEEIFNVKKNKDYDIVSFGAKVISKDKTKFIAWVLLREAKEKNIELLPIKDFNALSGFGIAFGDCSGKIGKRV